MVRTITVTIPDHRCTDEWWMRHTEETVADAIEMIGSLLGRNSDNSDASKRIVELQQRLEGANAAAQSAASAISERLEESWVRRSAEKDEMISFLQQQCINLKDMIEQGQKASDTHQKNAEHIINALKEQTNASKMQPCTIAQVGGIAENEVEQLLVETLACDVEDTSHQTGMGDRFVTTPNGLKLMLEVKNTERLHSKHDIEKFKRDVYEGVETQRINAALLLSLRSNSIPNVGGTCNVYFMSGKAGRVPVVMLSSNSRTAIQLSIHAIEQLQMIAEREMSACGSSNVPLQLETLEKERNLLMKTLPPIFQFIHENDTTIESRIDMLQRLLQDAESERSRQKEIAYQLLKLKQTVAWVGASQETSEQDIALSIVLKWFERKNEYPKTSEMTPPQRIAIKNAGGLKRIIDIAKKRKMEEIGDE